jgi:hypothetical protein
MSRSDNLLSNPTQDNVICLGKDIALCFHHHHFHLASVASTVSMLTSILFASTSSHLKTTFCHVFTIVVALTFWNACLPQTETYSLFVLVEVATNTEVFVCDTYLLRQILPYNIALIPLLRQTPFSNPYDQGFVLSRGRT